MLRYEVSSNYRINEQKEFESALNSFFAYAIEVGLLKKNEILKAKNHLKIINKVVKCSLDTHTVMTISYMKNTIFVNEKHNISKEEKKFVYWHEFLHALQLYKTFDSFVQSFSEYSYIYSHSMMEICATIGAEIMAGLYCKKHFKNGGAKFIHFSKEGYKDNIEKVCLMHFYNKNKKDETGKLVGYENLQTIGIELSKALNISLIDLCRSTFFPEDKKYSKILVQKVEKAGVDFKLLYKLLEKVYDYDASNTTLFKVTRFRKVYSKLEEMINKIKDFYKEKENVNDLIN